MTFPACALVILDGWGIAPPGPGNAVDLARTPVFDELWEAYPRTQLTAGVVVVIDPPVQPLDGMAAMTGDVRVEGV